VAIDITNTGKESVKFATRVDNPGATGRKGNNAGSLTLDPGETGTLVVNLQRPASAGLDEKLRGMDRSLWRKRGDQGGAASTCRTSCRSTSS
jgi:hypothetical protein